MEEAGHRQVTGARLWLAAASLPALAACGGDCDARLTVVNASGLAIASGTLASSREAVPLGSLPPESASEFRFHDLEAGAYSVAIRFADGTSHRDTSLGILTRGMRFRDTLVVHAPGEAAPLALKQSPGGCQEDPRPKTVVREILKKVF